MHHVFIARQINYESSLTFGVWRTPKVFFSTFEVDGSGIDIVDGRTAGAMSMTGGILNS